MPVLRVSMTNTHAGGGGLWGGGSSPPSPSQHARRVSSRRGGDAAVESAAANAAETPTSTVLKRRRLDEAPPPSRFTTRLLSPALTLTVTPLSGVASPPLACCGVLNKLVCFSGLWEEADTLRLCFHLLIQRRMRAVGCEGSPRCSSSTRLNLGDGFLPGAGSPPVLCLCSASRMFQQSTWRSTRPAWSTRPRTSSPKRLRL